MSIESEFDNDWLDIQIPDEELFNPMEFIYSDPDPEEVMKKLYIVMSMPEYFRFATKYILNVDLLPMQLVIIKELWDKKFPMMIACRGASKSFCLSVYCILRALLLPKRRIVIVGAAFRQSKFLYAYMKDIWDNAPVLRDLCAGGSGCFGGVDRCTVKINNSTITCLPLGSGDTIRGERAHDIVCDEFSCLGSDTLIQTDDGLIEISDWANSNAMQLLNKDRKLESPAHMVKTPLTDVYKITTENGYNFRCSNIHTVMTQEGWKLAKDLEPKKDSLILDTNNYFPERDIEKDGLVLDEEIGWLLGVLVSEGSVANRNYISITNTDKKLIDKIKDRFPHFHWAETYRPEYTDGRGWKCKESWVITYSSTEFRHQLFQFGLGYKIAVQKDIPKDILRSSRPVVIAFLSGLFEGDGSGFTYMDKEQNKKRIGCAYYSSGRRLIDQLHILLLKFNISACLIKRNKNRVSKADSWMLSIRGENAHKLCKLLDIIKWDNKFEDGHFLVKKPHIIFKKTKFGDRYYLSTSESNKNVHLGTFNTEQEAVDYFIEYKKTSNFVLKVRSVELLPKQEHLYDFYMPETNSFMGNGFIQHNSIPIDILETVVFGFGVVSSSPVEKVKRKKRERLGLIKIDESEPGQKGNQIVVAGTAYYTFNHFYDYWKKYKTWLTTKGDKKKLDDALGTSDSKAFNWDDYTILRIPVGQLDEGLMDEGMIAKAKASIHTGTFNMEYEACVHAETQIITPTGSKNIVDIQIGDLVLTHKNRFRKVLKKTYKIHKGDMIEIRTSGYYKPYLITPNHPFFDSKDFIPLYNVEGSTCLSNLHELSGLDSINLCDYTRNFNNNGIYIYPKSSQNKMDDKIRDKIIDMYKTGFRQCDIAKETGVHFSLVSQTIKQSKKRPKTAVNSNIRLDYDFGVCVGYYASEGSCGSKGKTVCFSLDSHVDYSLQKIVETLEASAFKTFGISTKKYLCKTDENVNVVYNSRILVDLFKSICPGVCYDKIIDTKILFSNKEFLKGFIVGAFNGDGHIRCGSAGIQLTNENLITQIRLVLSIFNIPSNMLRPKNKGFAVINGKIHKTQQAYGIKISGGSFAKFINEFYPDKKHFIKTQNSTYLWSDDFNQYHRIKSSKIVDYYDYVYNLEVEEDNSYSLPTATVHNCFSGDSVGFFKRTLIESCTVKHNHPILLASGEVFFEAMLRGDTTKKYVIGVDPASEVDHFAIVVVEVNPDHRRIVHVWTTNKQQHKEKIKTGTVEETDFYAYCSRKIRDLMKVFPTQEIAIDSQGGGRAIEECLHDKDKIKAGEIPLWPTIDPEKPKDTDDHNGLHILNMVNFAKSDWTGTANHGLRKDMEDKVLLFPYYDPIALEMSYQEDAAEGRVYDTLEDCVMDIEELKDELAMIVVTQTATGRERWDTPDSSAGTGKKGKLRKDRYSALVMANMSARTGVVTSVFDGYSNAGGFSRKMKPEELNDGKMYDGPDWFINAG